MTLTDTHGVETIEEGEGGVTAGDIDLLFEDADNELKFIISEVSRAKFVLSKLLTKFHSLVEQYEYHVSGQLSHKDGPLFSVDQSDGARSHSRETDVEPKAVAGRSPQTSSQKATLPEAKKEKECVAGLNQGSSGFRRRPPTASVTSAGNLQIQPKQSPASRGSTSPLALGSILASSFPLLEMPETLATSLSEQAPTHTITPSQTSSVPGTGFAGSAATSGRISHK